MSSKTPTTEGTTGKPATPVETPAPPAVEPKRPKKATSSKAPKPKPTPSKGKGKGPKTSGPKAKRTKKTTSSTAPKAIGESGAELPAAIRDRLAAFLAAELAGTAVSTKAKSSGETAPTDAGGSTEVLPATVEALEDVAHVLSAATGSDGDDVARAARDYVAGLGEKGRLDAISFAADMDPRSVVTDNNYAFEPYHPDTRVGVTVVGSADKTMETTKIQTIGVKHKVHNDAVAVDIGKETAVTALANGGELETETTFHPIAFPKEFREESGRTGPATMDHIPAPGAFCSDKCEKSHKKYLCHAHTPCYQAYMAEHMSPFHAQVVNTFCGKPGSKPGEIATQPGDAHQKRVCRDGIIAILEQMRLIQQSVDSAILVAMAEKDGAITEETPGRAHEVTTARVSLGRSIIALFDLLDCETSDEAKELLAEIKRLGYHHEDQALLRKKKGKQARKVAVNPKFDETDVFHYIIRETLRAVKAFETTMTTRADPARKWATVPPTADEAIMSAHESAIRRAFTPVWLTFIEYSTNLYRLRCMLEHIIHEEDEASWKDDSVEAEAEPALTVDPQGDDDESEADHSYVAEVSDEESEAGSMVGDNEETPADETPEPNHEPTAYEKLITEHELAQRDLGDVDGSDKNALKAAKSTFTRVDNRVKAYDWAEKLGFTGVLDVVCNAACLLQARLKAVETPTTTEENKTAKKLAPYVKKLEVVLRDMKTFMESNDVSNIVDDAVYTHPAMTKVIDLYGRFKWFRDAIRDAQAEDWGDDSASSAKRAKTGDEEGNDSEEEGSADDSDVQEVDDSTPDVQEVDDSAPDVHEVDDSAPDAEPAEPTHPDEDPVDAMSDDDEQSDDADRVVVDEFKSEVLAKTNADLDAATQAFKDAKSSGDATALKAAEKILKAVNNRIDICGAVMRAKYASLAAFAFNARTHLGTSVKELSGQTKKAAEDAMKACESIRTTVMHTVNHADAAQLPSGERLLDSGVGQGIVYHARACVPFRRFLLKAYPPVDAMEE